MRLFEPGLQIEEGKKLSVVFAHMFDLRID